MRETMIESQNAFAPTLCSLGKFHVTDGQNTRVIRLRVIEGPNERYQIALCAFHSFFGEVQTNPGYIHATHA